MASVKIEETAFTTPPVALRKSVSRDVREKLATLSIGGKAVTLTFDDAKKSFGSFIQGVTAPLSPKKFKYHTVDDSKRKFMVWRIK